MRKLNKSQTNRACQLTSRGAHRSHVFAGIALAATVICAATADALPPAAYFRTRPAKPEIDSGVFARDAARDLGEVDRIVKGEIEVVGVTWAFPSNRVDWLFDASAKKGPYNPEWTWQLNRMSFWTALARAYTRTGDEKYARAFAQQFADCLKQTGGVPPERGYNNRGSPWRTIEEGIRLMGSWSVAFEAFRKSPAFTDELLIAFVKSAHAQARHLIAHRTGGNWLLMEMTGAYFFALDFPEFEDSESIRREALRVFSQAIKEQVLPDGLQYELSPNYHQVFHSSATRLYLRAQACGFGHEIPKDFLDPLRLGTEGPLALVTPAFTLPNFNDTFTDPLASSFSAAAKIFPERRDFLWLVTNGREGEPPKGETASRYLPYSGFAAMRTDWTPDATYLAFDVGPLGMGHWHQDKLSFVLWKGNECLVFDDGGGQYESSRRRNYGLSGYDHNTLLVDGLAQNRSGPKRVTAPIDAGWRSTKDEDFAFGIYDQEFGPKRQKLATQRREITFDKKRDVITICDVAESADGKEHDYTLLFQLDTTNVVVSADGRRVRAEYGAGKKYALEMEIGGDGGERAEAVTGRLKPSMAGWFVGREYLVPMVRPATTVFVKAPKGKTHRFRTVLRPVRSSAKSCLAPARAVGCPPSERRDEVLGDAILTDGWKFSKDPTHTLAAEGVGFDDSAWESVRVPHDWAISGPFNPKEHGGTGKLPWRGVGWYRRSLMLDAADAGKSVFLDFDGVMASPKVYVNGHLAGGWDYGYASFRVDATPFVKFGEKNVIAVRASTLDHHSRWYPGAGIYRKVVLKLRNPAHFAYNGIFVTTPQVSNDGATVRLEWELEGDIPAGAEVKVAVSGPGCAGTVPLRNVGTVPAEKGSLSWQEEKPALWDVETPNLYEAEVSLVNGGETLSRERVRFGIRTIAFPVATGSLTNDWASNGFHLNGRRVQLKGVDLHSDLGLLGMAFDKSAMRRQLALMKEMGANALRTSHNCPAPDVLDLCDEMGIVVWDECFDKWDGTAGRRKDENLEEYVERNLQSFVKRDRNHPSVITWSMGNEIQPYIEGSKWRSRVDGMTAGRFRRFRAAIRSLDPTRPVGIGCCDVHAVPTGMFAELDVSGWNYGAKYRHVKARNPDKPVIYTESASALSTYGHYEMPPAAKKTDCEKSAFAVGAYEHCAVPWGDIADVEFDRMECDRYVCGEFVWTGIDYLGEPTPFGKESRSSYFGIVDLTGVPKDRYYLYRSHWNKKDETVHILPHWNWKGREGKSVPVYVYTSGDSAELFLNGRPLGVRRKGEDASPRPSYYDVCAKYRLRWFDVPYEPGELRAVAYRGGKRIGETVMRTAGDPAALKLTVEPKLADDPCALAWVQVDVLDAKGVRNPLAMNRVKFKLEGPGKILGVGNGNPHAFEAFTETASHPLFFGKAMAVIHREGPGELTLTVSSDGLSPARAMIW